MLHIDFETASRVNLKVTGAHIYASDPSTHVLMMGYGFDEAPPRLWLPGDPFPADVAEHIAAGGDIKAFNAQFERLIFEYVLCNDYDVPLPTPEQFYCVAAQARANNMPGQLDACARALRVANLKDSAGKALIDFFCVPRADGTFNKPEDDPAKWHQFCEYCKRDVAAERDVSAVMRPLTDAERDDYLVNELINDAGLMVDRELAEAAVEYANAEQLDLLRYLRELTDGELQKVRGKTITNWVYERLGEDERTHMHTYRGGERKVTFDKNARERLLSCELDSVVREVIECSDFAQAASTGKYQAMGAGADDDDRVRGCYILNGAGSTGRYSARRVQPHNMPRKGYPREVADELRAMILGGRAPEELEQLAGNPLMQILKGLLRYTIRAEDGKTFVCGDWSQIEGRVNPWLAMGIRDDIDRSVQRKLAIYADPTRDVYCETASDILGRPITKDDPERQGYGKVPELSLGFGGGAGAFKGMARGYGVNLGDDEVQGIVSGWRAANPWAQPFWYALFDAAKDAMLDPGVVFSAGRVSYLFQPDIMHGTLWCLLPSGRLLSYPHARLEWKLNKFENYAWELSAMKAAWPPKAGDTHWPRVYLWPGLLCENVTQAAAADVLREALATMIFEYDAPVVGHTHDEMLLEVPNQHVDYWRGKLESVMVSTPSWAEGLPLACEIWTDDRYRK